jgi:endonuclease-3
MSFQQIIAVLEKHYGRPQPPKRDPLGLIIWENIGYLVDDARRKIAFEELERTTHLKPTAILATSLAELTRIAKLGGIHEGLRAQRLKEIAHIALNEFDGDLSSILKLSRPKAIKALKQFPSIGDPGAEKILLFAGAHSILAVESNGLRVLLRLGFGEEKKSYSASYKSVQAALENQVGNNREFLIAAHQLLRQHGQELCKRSNPRCAECPVRKTCEYFLQTFAVRNSSDPLYDKGR